MLFPMPVPLVLGGGGHDREAAACQREQDPCDSAVTARLSPSGADMDAAGVGRFGEGEQRGDCFTGRPERGDSKASQIGSICSCVICIRLPDHARRLTVARSTNRARTSPPTRPVSERHRGVKVGRASCWPREQCGQELVRSRPTPSHARGGAHEAEAGSPGVTQVRGSATVSSPTSCAGSRRQM